MAKKPFEDLENIVAYRNQFRNKESNIMVLIQLRSVLSYSCEAYNTKKNAD